MESGTVHVLTALHALAHRIALTAEDGAALERHAGALSPELWRQSRGLLRAADRHGAGSRLDLGFTPLILRWLDLPDEDAFAGAHGLGIAESLARDCGSLDRLAEAIESPDALSSEALRQEVTVAWCARASVLIERLPHTARAAIEAIERAIEHCPPEPMFLCRLHEALHHASTECGDRKRAERARGRIEELRANAELRAQEHDTLYGAAAQILAIVWCIAHDDLLLDAERGLDPGIERSPETWDRVRAAIEAGCIEEVPLPVRTFAAWHSADGFDEADLRDLLSYGAETLAESARAVESLWGGEPCEPIRPSLGARLAKDAAFARRARIEQSYDPLPGERRNLFYEVHQGARRPESVERAALIHRMHALLLRCERLDPAVVASIYLDLAVQCNALGKPEAELRHLDEALALFRRVENDPARRDYGEVCLATYRWREGEVAEARRILQGLEGPKAAEAREEIAAKEPERAALRQAEREAGLRGGLGPRCEVALAHVAAGHTTLAERLAKELCRSHPQEPLAWVTLAEMLCEQGRYRDAVAPARTALEQGNDGPAGCVLLARSLRGTGPEGREESRALAVQAIEGHPDRGTLTAPEFAELARIAHDGGADLALCRRADDHVWALSNRGEEPPGEWLGAAAARRCHGVWAPDAPLWLARIAEAAEAEPAELARFVVERVEALLYFRLLAGRTLFGPIEGLDAERTLSSRARERLEERFGLDAQSEAAQAAARAAIALGYAEPITGEAFACPPAWEPSLPAIESGLGIDAPARLHAGELAQAVLFGPGGAGEREALALIERLDDERVAWIEWAARQGALREIAEAKHGAHSTGTDISMRKVLEIADWDQDEIRQGAWATRWHESERR